MQDKIPVIGLVIGALGVLLAVAQFVLQDGGSGRVRTGLAIAVVSILLAAVVGGFVPWPMWGSSAPASRPASVAQAFYEGLKVGIVSGDFHAAYNLMSHNRQAQRSYDDLKRLYSDTKDVAVGGIRVVQQSTDHATLSMVVTLTIADGAVITNTVYDVHYQLVPEGGDWRMDDYTASAR